MKVVYGRLTVLKEVEPYISPKGKKCKMFLCNCLCGKEKIIRIDSLNSGLTKSCGCLASEISVRNNDRKGNKGEKNGNWKGGITDVGHSIRTSNEYKEWRTECFERDNYTCQVSGEKGGDLVVHHLEPFYLLLDDMNYEMIYNLENGITISKDLHYKFHKEYGFKNFSKKDFEYFCKNNK